MAVLVFAESSNGKFKKSSFEAIHYGSKIASSLNTQTVVLTIGEASADSLSDLGKYGANKVLNVKNARLGSFDSQLFTEAVDQAVKAENADVIIFSHDSTGKSIAPRLSARLKAGLVAGAIALPEIGGTFSVRKNVFSGKAFADYVINSSKKIISLLPNSIPVVATDNKATVSDFNVNLDSINTGVTVQQSKKESGKLTLNEAEIVVSAGRGLKGPENWGIIEDLATSLGAATACSRPVADIGWRPHGEHVGQTGVAIRPNLYIAVGISGAIQHLAGVNGSKVMVVINKDPEAPFFKAADYGIVGDAFEILPKLTEAFKKFKAGHN